MKMNGIITLFSSKTHIPSLNFYLDIEADTSDLFFKRSHPSDDRLG